jgi:hypothetical protein
MKRSIEIVFAALFMTGNILTHLWGWMPAKWQNQKFDLFIKPGFHYEMSFAWWVYELTECMNKVIVLFICCMMADMLSRTLFKIVFIFMLYEVANFWLLLWNYKQTKETYWIMSTVVAVSLVIILRKHGMKMVK